jgi:hypothetical protein
LKVALNTIKQANKQTECTPGAKVSNR